MSRPFSLRVLDVAGAIDGQVPTYDAVTGIVTWADPPGASGGIESIVPGPGISVDATDPLNPVVSATDGGGGGTTDPRLLYRDDCAAGALPSGASSSGVTFDATELRRVLTGPATYASAAVALRGTVMAVASVTQLSSANAGDLHFQIMKGTSRVCRISLQADGNVVAYDSAGGARGNTGTSTSTGPADGQSLRLVLTVATNGQCSATVSNLGGGSTNSVGNGQQTWGINTHRWASNLGGLTAGDALTVQLVQEKPGATARIVSASRVVVTNGAALM